MSKLVIPFSFSNGMGGIPMTWFINNINAVVAFYNGMIDSSNIRDGAITQPALALNSILDENIADLSMAASHLNATAATRITYDKMNFGCISPASMAALHGVDNIQGLRTADDNTKQVRIVRGQQPASIELNQNYPCYNTTTTWSSSCTGGDPGFKEAPYLIKGQFVPDSADWAEAIVPISAVPFNISTVSCQWRISVAQGDSNLLKIVGKIHFVIYDLGGF